MLPNDLSVRRSAVSGGTESSLFTLIPEMDAAKVGVDDLHQPESLP